MLFDKLLDLIRDAVVAFAGKSGAMIPPVPGWVAEGADMVRTVLGYASSLGAWVPLPVFGVVVASVVVCFVAGITIKLARIAISFLTLGGGAAG